MPSRVFYTPSILSFLMKLVSSKTWSCFTETQLWTPSNRSPR